MSDVGRKVLEGVRWCHTSFNGVSKVSDGTMNVLFGVGNVSDVSSTVLGGVRQVSRMF